MARDKRPGRHSGETEKGQGTEMARPGSMAGVVLEDRDTDRD